jgi:gliding motility-associated-like protein
VDRSERNPEGDPDKKKASEQGTGEAGTPGISNEHPDENEKATGMDKPPRAGGGPSKEVDEGTKKGSDAADASDRSEHGSDDDALVIDGQSIEGGNEKDAGTPSKEENPIPTDLEIRADRSEGCPGMKVNFELSERPEDVDHFWKFGDGGFSNKADPAHRFSEPGQYRVTATLTDQKTGKTRKFVAEDPITVHEKPSANIERMKTPRRLRRARKVTVLELEDRENVDRVTWALGDGTRVRNEQRVVHQYPVKGIYSVKAYLKGAEGCRDTVRFQYEQKKSYDRTLLAPNAFAPNGDGRNDRFIPKALKVLDVPFTLTIHDRSGRVVYKTNNPSEPWNGRLQNSGERMKEGVYLWVVVLQNKKGEEETYKDAITLKR